MSRIAEYRQLEAELERQRTELERQKNDPELQKDVAFEAKLQGLLGSYKMGLADLISILEPGFAAGEKDRAATEKRTIRPREVKVYRNSLTGETVESKGGNNKLLAEWKARFGSEEVELGEALTCKAQLVLSYQRAGWRRRKAMFWHL